MFTTLNTHPPTLCKQWLVASLAQVWTSMVMVCDAKEDRSFSSAKLSFNDCFQMTRRQALFPVETTAFFPGRS
jgi:hypothetical protein